MVGPCSGWAPLTGVCPTWASYAPATQDYALAFATQVLWSATGRQFGLCPRVVRPCTPAAMPLYLTYPASYWSGVSIGSDQPVVGPYGAALTGCGAGCGSCCDSSLPLAGPVASITSVQVGAATLDPSAYELRGDHLWRVDGGRWPTSQDLSLAPGDEGAFAITYQQGSPVPDVLNMAAGRYACEVAKGMSGGTCQLPGRIQSISRQGVDITLVSSETYLEDGLTGFAEVDQLIRSFNPHGHSRRTRVWSPDVAL